MLSFWRARGAVVAAAAFALCSLSACEAEAQFWEWHEAPCDRDSKHGRAPEPCTASIVLSPYHLFFPMAYVSVELRVWDWLGLSVDQGYGWYNTATVAQWGLRLPAYPLGDFTGGLQLGPMARVTKVHYATARAIDPPSADSVHGALSPVYNDLEIARANGRDAAFVGLLVGGKFVMGARHGVSPWHHGLTLQIGLMAGHHMLLGPARHGPHPDAAITEDGFLGLFYAEAGWSL